MKYEFDSAEIGLRIKRARQAKGWSQETLAEKANCTAQYISKFEKQGLSDMTWITLLSNVLDTDLMEAVIDVESKVSEIGREILITLVADGNGLLDTEDLFDDIFSYGLSETQMTNEIVKLTKCGLVVREIYNDWDNNEVDRIFITAKGLITLKNMDLNARSSEIVFSHMEGTETYEMIIGEYNSYQEYIDSRPEEKLIRGIYDEWFANFVKSGVYDFPVYRVNFIKYIMHHLITDRDYDSSIYDYLNEDYCVGENCYHDILFRMALNITNEMLSQKITAKIDEFEETSYEYTVEPILTHYGLIDRVRNNAKELFHEEFCIEGDYVDEYSVANVLAILRKESDDLNEIRDAVNSEDELNQKIENGEITLSDFSSFLLENHKEIFDSIDEKLKTIEIDTIQVGYIRNKPEGASPYPCDWFTKEKIEEFINENFGSSTNEIEEGIDRTISEIVKLVPDLLDYYKFPREWEENGLAELVRSKIGLKKVD